MNIQTSRLTLVPATAELVALEIHSREAFGDALQATVPADWPPELLVDALPWFLTQLETTPDRVGWLCWYGLRRGAAGEPPVLVASAGFFGPPQDGTAEIGYSVLPQFQGQGYATEMVGGLVHWALAQPGVRRIVAETHIHNKASQRVLEKLAFSRVGPGREADNIQFGHLRAPGEENN